MAKRTGFPTLTKVCSNPARIWAFRVECSLVPDRMIEAMSAAAISREWVGRFADGRFPLLQWLGGSQATGVFLTELTDHPDLTDHSQRAVIKLIPADFDDVEARVAAWEAATTLSHPNLMKVYTQGRCEIDDVPCVYVVTEFADEVLAEILSERPLTTKETRDLLGPALDALRYLHADGLVHGRLNPSNIMAVGDSLKLTTYGVCPVGAAVISGPPRTVCDAPETEYGPIAPASDVWSLGATLVEVLTKYPPDWNRARAAEPTVPESMPEPFASIARKCLRSDPARRITLDEIAARLDPAKSPSRPEEKPATASPQRRRIALPMAIVALVLAGVGIWFALSHRAQPPSTSQQAQNSPVAAPVQTPAQAPAPEPTATPSLTAGPDGTATTTPAQTTPPALTTNTPPATNPAPVAAPVPPPQPAGQAEQAVPATYNLSPAPTTINPAIVNQILPDIIPSAMRTISGTVKVSVRLAVDENGKVTDAALASAGPSNYFASKSLEAARRWKFKPAQIDGRAAPSNWTLEFQYRRAGIKVVPEQTTP
jgi:TonB family protein